MHGGVELPGEPVHQFGAQRAAPAEERPAAERLGGPVAGLVPQQVGDRLADPGGEAPRGETAVVPRAEVRGAEVRGAAIDAAGGGDDAVVQQGDLGELGPEVDDEQRAGEVGTGGEREGPDGVDREDGARAQVRPVPPRGPPGVPDRPAPGWRRRSRGGRTGGRGVRGAW
ncbi:hypothetical protein AB7952_02125 [Streptomyces sp. PG2]